MLMVIFGAGASFDSCPTYLPGAQVPMSGDQARLNKLYRPPLANELFENRPLFAEAIDRFPECRTIVPRLRNLGERSLEATLEDIQGQSEAFPRAKQELAAVRCYLHRVITETEREWQDINKHVTNHLTLLREIERSCKEPVCLVTFNYDTLLEDALLHFGLHIDSMSAYTQKHAFYKLFKLHGSVTWARQVEPEIVSKSINPDEAMRLLIQRVAELRITDRYIFNRDRSMGIVQGTLAFPAIAIPVETKRNFECPPSQLEELIALLPQTSKILAIGWRATEAHFLALLKENLSRSVQMWIVAGPDQRQGQDIKDRFCREMLPKNVPIASVDQGGFTEFMLTGRAAQFLAS